MTAATQSQFVAKGTAHGTFGELLQGMLPDGDVEFLVTLPVARQAVARFQPSPIGGINVVPEDRWKAKELAENLLAVFGDGMGGTLWLDGDLPVGKGMASSSADLIATARAISGALGIRMEPLDIERWLRGIEPTDGVMYPGIVVFEHCNVRLRAMLGSLPPAVIVGVDEGGTVDTISFNERAKSYSEAEKQEYAQLLSRLTAGVLDQDLRAIGEVATRSCMLADRNRARPALPELLAIREEIDAAGVVCAHSGTVLGLLIEAGLADSDAMVSTAIERCRSIFKSVTVHHPV